MKKESMGSKITLNHSEAKRVGIIRMGADFVMGASTEVLSGIFSRFYPYRIETEINPFGGHSLIYYGLSSRFDTISPSDLIPEYAVTIKDSEPWDPMFERKV